MGKNLKAQLRLLLLCIAQVQGLTQNEVLQADFLPVRKDVKTVVVTDAACILTEVKGPQSGLVVIKGKCGVINHVCMAV